jgi:serine/threonine protein kinase
MTLGGYRLNEFIRAGQFGLVFAVDKVDTKSSFAMKILPPSADAGAHLDFDNEGTLLKKLNRCSSVVNLIDTGVESVMMTVAGGPAVPVPFRYHVLGLASGSLEELTTDPSVLAQLSWPERISLWRSAIKGVHQMHLKCVAHRDLKSSNCLIVVGGSRSEVRIADLGRSKDLASSPVHHEQVYLGGLGDFRYAPPEYLWLQGGSTAADFRNADLYGLGSLFTELTTGHPMTALAMTSWIDAQQLGIADFKAGIRRDLATLRPQFRAAIAGLADNLPSAIRHSGVNLLTQLCDPVPQARPPQRAPGRRYLPDDGLLWLLNRADILKRQLATAPRRRRYSTLTAGRSA